MILILLSVMISFAAYAQEVEPQSEPVPDVQPVSAEESAAPVPSAAAEPPHNIKAGVTFQNYRYEEPGLISHNGIMIGAWLNWFYQVNYYTGVVQTELNTGRLDYDGALCDINTNQCHDYKAKTNDLILRASHRFTFEVTDSFNVFAGVGYRYLLDKGEGTGFYRRTGQYWIMPVGFTVTMPWSELEGNVVFDAEYDVFLKGQIESKLSDVNKNFSDVKHTQNNGRALKITMGFEPKPTPENPHPWMFYAFFENWSIPESEKVQLIISGAPSGNFFYEPENRSNAFGLRVGWAY